MTKKYLKKSEPTPPPLQPNPEYNTKIKYKSAKLLIKILLQFSFGII